MGSVLITDIRTTSRPRTLRQMSIILPQQLRTTLIHPRRLITTLIRLLIVILIRLYPMARTRGGNDVR